MIKVKNEGVLWVYSLSKIMSASSVQSYTQHCEVWNHIYNDTVQHELS